MSLVHEVDCVAAFLTQAVVVDECTVKFEIWDTAGQERYHSLAPMYYRGAAAAVVVYDITSKASFVRAQNWVKELQRQGSSKIVIALAGNKYDLVEKQEVSREVSLDSILHLTIELGGSGVCSGE